MKFRIEPLGDCALLVELGEHIDAAINAQAITLADVLRAAHLADVFDIAPAYASVCVRYTPTRADACARLIAEISALAERTTTPAADLPERACVEVPICYGGEFGPDLDDVAQRAELHAQEVIARHAGAEYRVAMLGFAPGFPYLLGLEPALQTPRRARPRTRVPAGSVAIGGAQTGIYPRELPGGWHIIGRTPLRLFDATRAPPALLAPGQLVRFRAIGAEEFAALSP